MHISQLLLRLGASLLCAAGIANAAYTIEDNFNSTNFFEEFNFFSGSDPTHGFVDYVDLPTAGSIAGYSGDAVILAVDSTTVNPPGGRASVRLSSNKAYTHGLFIADIAHMPGGICGVWPAFWTFGPNWPASGEIDIIEGVNQQATDSITLHTSSGCTMTSTGSDPSSVLQGGDCNEGNAGTGCSFSTANTMNYGAGFNANGGGVYAMEWTSSSIDVYFFTRSAIPADITSDNPNPAGWGAPVASFSGCNIDQYFMNHNIIFDTTFCGDWAGSVWGSGQCASLANTCEEYVANNPVAFRQAYWLINSVKVYQQTPEKRELSSETPVAVPFKG